MPNNIERRTAGPEGVCSADPTTLQGYAANYSSITDMGEFKEFIAPGAFRGAIARQDDIRLLVDHNPSLILGRTKSGTLKVLEDAKGLRFIGTMPNTQLARDTMELVKRGDISGCSFGFVVGPGNDVWGEEQDSEGNSYIVRRINRFDKLYDVSVCTYPAYDSTSVAARTVVADAVLVEARAVAKRTGVVIVPTLGRQPYKKMTDYEIHCAVEEEKGRKGMAVGETPYPWQRGGK